MQWSVLAVQYMRVLRSRGYGGGESDPPRQLNKQQQPAQLGPNCTDRRRSRRGCRRWPSTREALAPRRVQENQARRLYTTVPGRSTSNAPVFCIPSDPFPRGDNGLGRVTKWNLGMTAVSNPRSLSTPQSQHRYEKRGRGQLRMIVRGVRRHCMLCRNPLTPFQRTNWKIVITLGVGKHHARPTCHFLVAILRRNCTWQRWRVATVLRGG